jgi:hypothetical protein
MWAEFVKQLATFQSAVLSGTDAEGYPCSVRCIPAPDHGAQTLRVAIGTDLQMRPGPASLLCHSHNDELWDLRSLNARGTMERDAQGWFLRPIAVIPEMGADNPIAIIRTIRHLRRTAANYFKQRNLPRPTVPWDKLEAVKKDAIARARLANQ